MTIRGNVSITPWQPDFPPMSASTAQAAARPDVFLLPDKFDSDKSLALYQDAVAGLVKTVNADSQGVISYSWPREERRYFSEYGAVDILLTIALGIAANISTGALKVAVRAIRTRVTVALGSANDDQSDAGDINVKIARMDFDTGTVIEGLEYQGPVSDVLDIIEKLGEPDPGETD